ncbi:MAG TPA: transglycosylase domain-containing protein [Rhodothermales bacterium]|nr:transglycosylase domain-containing protein [Rhodothermales bacterium]
MNTRPLRSSLNHLPDPAIKAARRLHRYGVTFFDPQTSWRTRIRYAAWGAFISCVAAFHFVLVYGLLLIPFTPGTASLKAATVENPSIVLSADGQEIVRYNRLNRKWVTLDQVAPVVADALISTEDARFYQHHGVDVRRLFAAVWETATGNTQGGSTITMQLARNLYPEKIGHSLSLGRKLKEIITALKLESVYTKPEILAAYLNTVPFLYNTYGIEMAARTYYGEPAADLDTLQAATLVGMLKGTAYYNPVRNPERARLRRNVVLAQMARRGHMTPARLAALQEKPVTLHFEPQSVIKSRAPHFTAYVRDQLSDWAEENGYDLYTDGLVIHTTLDLRLQDLAQQAVTRRLDALQKVADVEWGRGPLRLVSTRTDAYGPAHENVEPFSYFWSTHDDLLNDLVRESSRYRAEVEAGRGEDAALDSLLADAAFLDSLKSTETRVEGGFVAIDPRTGFVKAWVGSRNFYENQYDHVASAKRQPGSTFKPFVYQAALENGFSPNDLFVDRPIEIPLDDGSVWRPANFEASSGEIVTLREALAHSINTIAAELTWRLGPDRVADYARRMGIRTSKLAEVPSIALGTSDVTLLEMVSAYSTIAAEGVYRPPVVVTSVEDKQGNVLAIFAPEPPETVLDHDATLTLIDMLRSAIDGGTGAGIRTRFGVHADVAGKTGTTENYADGWFLLMHPRLVAGAWVGFDDRRVTFRTSYWGQGAHNALFIVGDFFHKALNDGLVSSSARFPDPPFYFDDQFDDDDGGSIFDRLGRWIHRRLDDDRRDHDDDEYQDDDHDDHGDHDVMDHLREEMERRQDEMERLRDQMQELQKERARLLYEHERQRRRLEEDRARQIRQHELDRAREHDSNRDDR